MMKTSKIAQCGLIAAIYAVMTIALPAIGFGIVQFRLGEALCVLPFFMPAAVPGLTLGCLVANAVGTVMGATTVWDVVFGTAATALASYMAGKIRIKWLVPLPAVVINAVVIGTMLTGVMTGSILNPALFINMASIAVSQTLSCYVLGLPLIKLLERTNIMKFIK